MDEHGRTKYDFTKLETNQLCPYRNEGYWKEKASSIQKKNHHQSVLCIWIKTSKKNKRNLPELNHDAD